MKNRKYIPEDIESYNKLKVKPLLFVRGLTKKYKGRRFPAITKLDFDVYPGEFHAFIGANGAGKTTTFKSLIGAYNNWDGTILINGKNNNTEDAKRKLGYIPENARFPSKFTTLEYLIAMTRLSGRTKEESITIATSKLKELKL
jgi:ABC-2 type transport system ATP-binding protein